MFKKRALILFFSVIVLSVLIFSGCAKKNDADNERTFFAMDTIVTVKLEGTETDSVFESIESTVVNLEKQISRNEESSCVSNINKNFNGKLDSNIIPYFTTMMLVNSRSDGAYNFCLGYLTDLWGFGSEEPKVPSDNEISILVENCKNSQVTLDPTTGTVNLVGSLLNIDFGSSGKGIALDEIKKKCLSNENISSCIAAVGGSVLLYGDRTFDVGIKDPNGTGNVAILHLPSSCVSTSGNYERYFEIDGKRYHHILDPETGYPVENELASVTIVSDNGTISDILSTACFVMGTEKGTEFCRSFDCEGVFITKDKKIYTTKETSEHLTISDSSYELVITDE